MAIVYTVGAAQYQRPFTTSATFTGLNVAGADFPSGAFVVVALGLYLGSGEVLNTSTITIGSVTASVISQNSDVNIYSLLVGATMPSAQADTCTIVDSSGNGWNYITAAACYMTGANTTASATSNVNSGGNEPITPSGSILLPSGGVGIVTLFEQNAIPPAQSWGTGGSSNITSSSGDLEVDNAGTNNNAQLLLAHSIIAGTWQPTVTGGGAYNGVAGMAAATFAPASSGGIAVWPYRV